jgi:hypothetical protein
VKPVSDVDAGCGGLFVQVIEDDHKRAEFMKWVDDNELDITEERPRYMHALPRVKPDEVEKLNGILEVRTLWTWEYKCQNDGRVKLKQTAYIINLL